MCQVLSLTKKGPVGPTEISYLKLVRLFDNKPIEWEKHTWGQLWDENIHDSKGQKIQKST